MYYKDIRDALDTLARVTYELEEIYTENEGEVTEETEALEEQKEAVTELLNGEGVDVLGRWLKSKEDEIKTYKAEKESVTRKIKSVENTIEFIKETIHKVMVATGCDKVRGVYYSFAPTVSTTTKADTALLKELYQERALKAIHDAGIPECVTVTLGASISAVPEGEDTPDFFTVTTKETVRFTKPRVKD